MDEKEIKEIEGWLLTQGAKDWIERILKHGFYPDRCLAYVAKKYLQSKEIKEIKET